MRVAAMQPYLWPYAGYYRLMAGVDSLVILDSVQHRRRGRIHRNQFTTQEGTLDWFTLPLAKAPQTVRIDSLVFDHDAGQTFMKRRQRFPVLSKAIDKFSIEVPQCGGLVADWLELQLKEMASRLEFDCQILRSSTIATPPGLHGADRILAICETLGATQYLNVTGGADLYDAKNFASRNIHLRLLPLYRGSFASLHERFLFEDALAIRKEIIANLTEESA